MREINMAQEIHRGMVLLFLDMAAECDPSRPGTEVEETPDNYRLRNAYVYQALGFAAAAGLPCGIDIDGTQPDWPIVYIGLPTGQVSWHVPVYPDDYDGHTTEEKYERIAAYRRHVESEVRDFTASVAPNLTAQTMPAGVQPQEPAARYIKAGEVDDDDLFGFPDDGREGPA